MAMYRSRTDGQLGALVEREGKPYIRLDRPNEELLRPFKAADWIAEDSERPLTKMQVARIAFEADKALCVGLGKYDIARKAWDTVLRDDKQRAEWTNGGPPASEAFRKAFYEHILSFFPSTKA